MIRQPAQRRLLPLETVLFSGGSSLIFSAMERKEDVKEKRFEFMPQEGCLQGVRILVDKETGVQYLLAYGPGPGGLAVPVDEDGKPLLDPRCAQ